MAGSPWLGSPGGPPDLPRLERQTRADGHTCCARPLTTASTSRPAAHPVQRNPKHVPSLQEQRFSFPSPNDFSFSASPPLADKETGSQGCYSCQILLNVDKKFQYVTLWVKASKIRHSLIFVLWSNCINSD